MQIKKLDIKLDILKSAEREFLIHGYHNGSMRSIAKRANTTIGNIYHYFPNKEALLGEIIGDLPIKLGEAIAAHETFPIDTVDVSTCIEDVLAMRMPELFPIDLLLSPRFLIFLGKCNGTKYDDAREMLIRRFNDHLKWHMNLKEDSILTETILQAFLSSLIFIATHMNTLEEGKRHLVEYIKVMSLGFPILPKEK